MGCACGAYGWGEGCVYRVLVGKPEGRRPLGRPRRWWVDNIRTDLQEVGYGSVEWIGLAQDRDRWRTLVSAVMNFRVPWNAGNFLTSCKPVSFTRRTLHHGVSKYIQFNATSTWKKRRVFGGNVRTNNNMPQLNGMNCIKIYNLSPFSQSLWKNIGIFVRNWIKKKEVTTDINRVPFLFLAAVYQVSLLSSYRARQLYQIEEMHCWICRDSFGAQGNPKGNTLSSIRGEIYWIKILYYPTDAQIHHL